MKFKSLKIITTGFTLLSLYAVNYDQIKADTKLREAYGKNGVVSAARPEASKIGLDILKNGGNAVDAAIATAFAIGVLEPNASGIGGGGFMLIRMADMQKPIFIDFREIAPKNSSSDMYKLSEDGKVINRESSIGGKSIAVPGSVAGLLTALEKYGTMKREEILQPAIEYAENGITITENLATIIMDSYDVLSQFPATSDIYLKDGLPYDEGDLLIQKDLSETLKKIAKEGKKAFYEGEVAKKIADSVQRAGGIITEEDLKNYEVHEKDALEGTYRGYTIISPPPASSGGTHIIQLFNIMENYDLKKMGISSPETLHVWAESLKQVFSDRAEYMGDTSFVDVPLEGLTSKEYAKEIYEKIDLTKRGEDGEPGDPSKYESGSTTHLSVMDKDGNMVAITQTINYFFGSGVTVDGTGIVMNNEMDDFEPRSGRKNSIEPGKKPLSSMSPTLVLNPDKKPLMTIGSPGATRIIPAVALTISNVIDHGMSIQEAISAPRIAQFQNGNLKIEEGIPKESLEKLKKLGHEIEEKKSNDSYFGGVHGVMMDYKTNMLHGGADPRRDGQAAAY